MPTSGTVGKKLKINESKTKIINTNADTIVKSINKVAEHLNVEPIKIAEVPQSQQSPQKIEFSEFQKAILKHIINLAAFPNTTQKHLIVEAVAGSGKTFTIEQATKLIPKNKRFCFLAFNKHIVKEFQSRSPITVRDQIMTLNSAGFRDIKAVLDNKKYLDSKKGVDKNNVDLILDELFYKNPSYSDFTNEQIDTVKSVVNDLVTLFKATLLPLEVSNLKYLSGYYNINTEDIDSSDLLALCKYAMDFSKDIFKNEWDRIDYNDQIWLPVALNLKSDRFDYVFIDEVQDLNKSKFELAKKMCAPGGSIIAVGDTYQAIYGFTGADTNAIENIKKDLKAVELPLSICYRCPEKHVKLAQKFVPHIQWRTKENSGKDALLGSIHECTMDQIVHLANAGDKIICRNSAPLIHPCYELIKNDKKTVILGRDIGEGLITLMKKIKGDDLPDFIKRLGKWKNTESEKLTNKKLPIDKIIDQYDTLMALSEDCELIECVLKRIKQIFSEEDDTLTEEEKKGIVLSTVHKAKGLEVKTDKNVVFVIMSYDGKPLMPSLWAKQAWEIQQEKNIQYIAFTRGKNKMYLVDNIEHKYKDLITDELMTNEL